MGGSTRTFYRGDAEVPNLRLSRTLISTGTINNNVPNQLRSHSFRLLWPRLKVTKDPFQKEDYLSIPLWVVKEANPNKTFPRPRRRRRKESPDLSVSGHSYSLRSYLGTIVTWWLNALSYGEETINSVRITKSTKVYFP